MKTSETVSSEVEATTSNKKSKSSSLDSDKELKKSHTTHQPPAPSINNTEGVRTCQTASASPVITSKTTFSSNNKTSNSSPPLDGKPLDKSTKYGGKTPSPNSIKISTKKSTSPLSGLYGKTTSEKFECLISYKPTTTSPPKAELKRSPNSIKPGSSVKQEQRSDHNIPLIKLPTSPIKFIKREIENSVHTISFSSPLLGPPTVKKLKLEKTNTNLGQYNDKKLPLEDTIGNIVREITKNDIVKDPMKIQQCKTGETGIKSSLSVNEKKHVNSLKPLPKSNIVSTVVVKDSLNGKVKDGTKVVGFTKVMNSDPKVQKENAMVANSKVRELNEGCKQYFQI